MKENVFNYQHEVFEPNFQRPNQPESVLQSEQYSTLEIAVSYQPVGIEG